MSSGGRTGGGKKSSNVLGVLRLKLQQFVEENYSHAVVGYSMRLAAVTGIAGFGVVFGYNSLVWGQEARPISQRWAPYYTPIRFVERRRQEGTKIDVFRFALPNSYDYTGHDVVSSCEIDLCDHWLFSTRRFYTPISHPEQRGFVEFAIKDHDPGAMSHQLRELKPGEVVYITRWLREFRYKPNTFDEIGFIAANSGITPALQMLNVALADKNDATKFSLLVLALKPEEVPFRTKLLDLQRRFPTRFKVSFASKTGAPKNGFELTDAPLSTAYHQAAMNPHKLPLEPRKVATMKQTVRQVPAADQVLIDGAAVDASAAAVDTRMQPYREFVGSVDKDMVLETMPLPGTPKTKILVCGPNSVMSFLCGRSFAVFRHTYLEGMYHGMLRELGYRRSDVYKFGSTVQLQGFAH